MEDSLLMLDCQFADTRHSGGAGTYVQKLVNHLVASEQTLPFSLKVDNFFVDSAAMSIKNVKGRVKDLSQAVLPQFAYNFALSTYRAMYVRRFIEKNQIVSKKRLPYSIVLLHELTNYSAHHRAARLLSHGNVKLVTTFLDIQDCFYPEFFDDYELLQRRLNYAFYADCCEHMIAISDHTKKTMVEVLGIHPDRISVIHLASDVKPPTPDARFEQKIKDLGRYFVYPAKLWAHKNHRFLLTCMSHIKGELKRSNTKLVLTGGMTNQEVKDLTSQIKELGLDELVIPMGFLSANELKLLLANAFYLVFPSLFEGFGMPVVEAMQLGCPVISSTAGSLSEICLDSALMFDPKDHEQLEQLLLASIGDKIDRLELIDKAKLNANRFSWERCIGKTFEVYKKVFSLEGSLARGAQF